MPKFTERNYVLCSDRKIPTDLLRWKRDPIGTDNHVVAHSESPDQTRKPVNCTITEAWNRAEILWKKKLAFPIVVNGEGKRVRNLSREVSDRIGRVLTLTSGAAVRFSSN